ncbi:MAG: flagellar filament capping protein FliD [Planctomycetota bacterium]|nr:flagellar filament capping protein FliD [Planctomycetota bacterium]
MSGVTTGVGLISGINFTETVDALMSIQQRPVQRLQSRSDLYQTRQTALKTVEAGLLSLATTVTQLKSDSSFKSFTTTVAQESSLRATARSSATAGTYHFQAIQKSATHEIISKGLANADTQTFGTGTITIARDGYLNQPTQLDLLNEGQGIRRGSIRITDRTGAVADVDLSNAYTVEDVVRTINSTNSIQVTASTVDGGLVLEDTSGSTASNLIVTEVANGHAAEDLGLAKSIAGNTLTGDSVYTITGDFTLAQLDDGNGPHIITGAADLRITLTDDSTLDITLDGAANLGDVVNKINDDTNNAGRVTAALVSGQLELTDNSGGGGSSAFAVTDLNSASVVRSLGLDATATGTTLSGKRLIAGLDSVLLRNVRGGQGIDQLGQVSLTDRTGRSATIDLSAADSLDQVIHAINTATDGGGTRLTLTARIDDRGTGIRIDDTSGSTANNLTIADVGGSTLATQLGIAGDVAATSVKSGSLNRRHVSQSTALANYAPDGGGVQQGSFQIKDSSGATAIIDVTSSVNTIGDLIQRINAVSGISVQASLNDTGDGFVITDQAGGASTLTVTEVGASSTAAADLRILGEATGGSIQSRLTTVVDVEATDTLNDIVDKINAAGSFVSATAINDGSNFNSTRLSLLSTQSGYDGRLIVDDGGLNLGLATRVKGQDSLLRTGQNVDTGFVVASNNDSFNNVVAGLDIDVLAPETSSNQVTVDRNLSKMTAVIKAFVGGFNSIVDTVEQSTGFDLEADTKGVLQGDGFVLRIMSRLDSVVHGQFTDSGNSIRSMSQLGITVGLGGKLRINDEVLQNALEDSPQAVSDFFLGDGGFATGLESTLTRFTDPFDGSFKVETESLQSSIDGLANRITELDEILDLRRDRMLREFIRMEEAIASLSSQQQAISSISLISVQRRSSNNSR